MVNGIPEGRTAEDQAKVAEDEWSGYVYTEVCNDAWTRLLNYYKTL